MAVREAVRIARLVVEAGHTPVLTVEPHPHPLVAGYREARLAEHMAGPLVPALTAACQ
jgi:hypothetical protein